MTDVHTNHENWKIKLSAALLDANVPTLLMVLVHLTADMSWLGERYKCSRIKGLDDNDTGGLDDEAQVEIRRAAFDAIVAWKQGKSPELAGPGDDLIAAMLVQSTGEKVPKGYVPMVAAGLGLDAEYALDQRASFASAPPEFHVVVIGAGVAGLCTAIRLEKAGLSYTVIEKNEEVGGTWFENKYPGAGVDTPSHIYSYSFSKNDWKRYFAERGEIQSYFEGVADTFCVRPNIRFKTKVESAKYDETSMEWVVTTVDSDGKEEVIRANILVAGTGLLNIPRLPNIAGLREFRGDCFHTACWPEGYELAGKRVAVIGNGASAMQVVPAIADKVQALTVFQRSKQWAAPFERFQQEMPETKRFLLREVAFYQEWYRQRLAWIFNDRVHSSLQIDPEWPHKDRSINRRNDKHREFFIEYIKKELGDRQDLLPKVVPDYPPFGKRMLLDNGWYRTLRRPNVRLVDSEVARIEGNRVVSASGESDEVDVIIIATGFDAHNMLGSFNLQGRGGKRIRDAWAENGPEAHMGLTHPGFPNFFMLAGPNTGLGHGGSVVAMLEAQARYVMGIIKHAVSHCSGGFELEVRKDVHDTYNTTVCDLHSRMIWAHTGTSTWFRAANGRVIGTTPFRNDDYWNMLRKTDMSHYSLRCFNKRGLIEVAESTEMAR